MNNNITSYVELVTDKVKNTISRQNLIERGSSVLVAVSGGADSVCLLHIMSKISKIYEFDISAAHLNHCIRGAEADLDEEYVVSLCDKLHIKCFTERTDVPKLAKSKGLTEEEAGRQARYKFFSRITSENNIDYIATAHNKNDQAETVLMRIIRGSGLTGLRGIKYKREDGVIRPLLDVSREEIEGYCCEAELDFKTDSTNKDDNYTRNKIRHQLIPLVSEINPSAVDALSNLSKTLGEDADFIDDYAKRLYARINPPIFKGSCKAIDIESLKLINSRSIVSRLIILCARDAMGSNYSLEKKHIDSIYDFIESESNGSINLPKGLTVQKRYGWLEFKLSVKTCGNINNNQYNNVNNVNSDEKELNLYNNKDFCIEVQPNKLYNIKYADYGYKIRLDIVSKDNLQKNSLKKIQLENGDIALDWDIIAEGRDTKKLIIRNRRDGDRIAVYKNGMSRKLKNLFIDLKIRREERNCIPLLCDDVDNIFAVVGIRASEEYKMTKATDNILVVHYERYEN